VCAAAVEEGTNVFLPCGLYLNKETKQGPHGQTSKRRKNNAEHFFCETMRYSLLWLLFFLIRRAEIIQIESGKRASLKKFKWKKESGPAPRN
jgi:hypothetical protein